MYLFGILNFESSNIHIDSESEFCLPQDATIYVGGLDEKVSDSLLWELFVQAGPVVNVHMPKDRVTMLHQVSDNT